MNKSIQNDFVNQRTRLSSLIMQILLWLIRAYQYVLSPWLGPSCRYLPSCSEYAREALDNHGLWQGGWLALRRISRCHPLGASGYDPVPTTSAGTGRQCQNGHGDWHGN